MDDSRSMSPGPDLTGADQPALLNCDLVMKGGITSGLVYPKAVARIAHRYRLRSIGGTSIGAVLTASAEYWRQTHATENVDQQVRVQGVISAMEAHGWDTSSAAVRTAEQALIGPENPDASRGFAGLYAIPQDIGDDLVGKFQPTLRTRALFNYAITIMSAPSAVGKILAAVVREFYYVRWVAALLIGLIALSCTLEPRLWAWLALPILALVGLGILQSTVLQSHIRPPVKPMAQSKPRLTLAITVGLLGGLLGGIWWLIHRSLGWLDIRDWVIDWVEDNPFWAALIGAVFILTFTWKAMKPQIVSWLPGDSKLVEWRLTQLGGLLGFTGVIILIWQYRGFSPATQGRVAPFGVGFTIGWLLGGFGALLFYLAVMVPSNLLGICTGLGNRNALTNWLTSKIDTVAGVEARTGLGRHLTFGDLKQAGVAVESIASDLRRGVPLDIPKALHNYRFRPDEFRRLFPASVVDQLIGERTIVGPDQPVGFPEWEEIPVIVGARMSMSFPVLFSPIPVYYKDGITYEPSNPKNWLSDGGIVSNFPLHKFDRALPPWPTFAMDLIDQRRAKPAQIDEQVVINRIRPSGGSGTSSQAAPTTITDVVSDVATSDLMGLGSRILNTARGWMDNSQKTLPGYAERIIGVYLYEGEGGLNLKMDADKVEGLALRGMYGADQMVRFWEPVSPNGEISQWDEHRWLRYKIVMRELEQLSREWKWVYDPVSEALKSVHQPSIKEYVTGMASGDLSNLAFRWGDPESAIAGRELTDEFQAFARGATARRRASADNVTAPVTMQQETPDEENLGPQVFNQPFAPVPAPKRLMIPPFE